MLLYYLLSLSTVIFKNVIMRKFMSFFAIAFAIISTNLNAQLNMSFIGAPNYGNITEMVYDLNTPNYLYASNLSNHIFISKDNGDSWEIFKSFPEPSLAVSQIKNFGNSKLTFLLDNPNRNTTTLYFIDVNSKNVTSITAPTPENATSSSISSYDISNSNPNCVLVNISYQEGIVNFNKSYYTNDNGVNWTQVYYNVEYGSVYVESVAIHPTNPNKLYLLRSQGPDVAQGGLLISDDAGQNWSEKLEGNILSTISFDPNDSNKAFMGTGISFGQAPEKLLKTIDAGNTWEEVQITWNDMTLNNIKKIKYNPSNSNHIVALEENQVLVSVDNGNNWTSYLHFQNGDSENEYYYGNRLTFNPFSDELLVSGSFRSFRSRDGGITFSRMENLPFFNTGFLQLSNVGDKSLYYGLQGGIVRHNLRTNTRIFNNVTPIGYGEPIYKFYVDNAVESRLYMGYTDFMTQSVLMKVSTDDGQTFNTLNSFTDINSFGGFISSSPANSNTLYFANMCYVYKMNITDLENAIVEPRDSLYSTPITALYVDKQDEEHVMIAYGDTLFRTTDGAQTWNHISTVPKPVINIVKNPHNNMYLALTTQGIFMSTDLVNWEVSFESDNMFASAAFSPNNPNLIVAASVTTATSSTTLVSSTDGGDSWFEYTPEMLNNVNVNGSPIQLEISSNNIANCYLHTARLGVVQFSFDMMTTSVDEEHVDDTSNFFPNPTSGIFHINKDAESILCVDVYSTTGLLLAQTFYNNCVDISHLNNGVYIVSVQLKNNEIVFDKIIKK